jgi:hypothetical protein
LPLNDAADPSISTLSPADATALQNAILQAENAIKQAGSVQSLLNSAAVLVGTVQQRKGGVGRTAVDLKRRPVSFEIEAFFNFSDTERRVIEDRRGPALKLALALPLATIRYTRP